jgi:TolB-like protein/Tfp pilus assembly protein PilF/predicted Ser/Thr protein kinase
MKTATTFCGRCGAKISGDATGQVCSACLLEMGLGLLEDNNAATGVVDPGRRDGLPVVDGKKAARSAKILIDFGDYELLEEIGRGGQGVVYRAHQKSLNRTVALKVIGLGPWTTETHRKRFRREAEAAASLEHPGIVPVHEVGERDGSCYFSMKFVGGGQLDGAVTRTLRSIRQSAELIAKVARTVHFAHEHGIVHLDIKPGNILLDGKGEPLLTDFGLAQLVETKSTVTHTKEVLGTPSYMAPEQAAGQQTKLSNATDVYGLGAVLYQLITSHPPFTGGTSYETIRLLLDTEPRQPRLWNRKIDRELSTICLKCLEKDPKRRYSSALALAEDLEHWLKHEPIRAKPSGFFTRSRKWVRRNPTAALLVTSLAGFAVGIGVIVSKTESFRLLPEPSIAVLPFQNASGDPNDANFADGIQEEILRRLARIHDLKVIWPTSTQHYQSKPRNLSEIAKQLGVANILEGSVQKADDQVRVNVQLINAQTHSDLWAETYDRKLTDMPGVENEIAKLIAELLGAKLSDLEQQALAVKPTKQPETQEAYLQGLAIEARNYSPFFSRDQVLKACMSYECAVQLDPYFANGWARLSRSEGQLYFSPFDHIPVWSNDAKHALEKAQTLEPNSPETLLALGYYQYRVLLDCALAKMTFDRVTKMLPGSSEVKIALSRVARHEGHWDESIAYFEQALTQDTHNLELLVTAAETYTMLRQFPTALKLYDRALDIAPNDPDMTAAKAGIYQAEGNLEQAARVLSEISWQTRSEGSFTIKIAQLRLERNYAEAIRLLQARLAQFHFESPYDKAGEQLHLAFMQRVAGDTFGARVTGKEARDTIEDRYRYWGQPHEELVARMSQAYAATEEKDSALNIAQRAIMFVLAAKDRMQGPRFEENLAFIQTIVGENSSATSILTQLLQTPYKGWLYASTPVTPAFLRLDPIWDPLRGDPAFQKLCEEKQP